MKAKDIDYRIRLDDLYKDGSKNPIYTIYKNYKKLFN